MPWLPIGPAGSNYETFVDDCDVELVKAYSWYCDGAYVKRMESGKRYLDTDGVRRRKSHRYYYLHREIMKPKKGLVVHHIDNNGLNNSRSNFAIVTVRENNRQAALYRRGVVRI